MDTLWLASPSPAIRLQAGVNGAVFTPNAAARAWSAGAAWPTGRLDEFAGQLLDRLRGGAALQGVSEAHGVRWHAVALDDGWLVWLLTSEPLPVPARGVVWGSDADKLALMQEFAGIGILERNLVTGEGRWDDHLFRMFGLDPGQGVPDFPTAMERIHPDDRAAFQREHERIIQRPGRYELRFRVLLPGGEVRHMHSMVEVRHAADGRPALLFGVILDDSQGVSRVRAQEAVSAQLAKALRLARVSVARVDVGSQRVHFNDVGYEINGFDPNPEGVDVAVIRARAHPDDRAAIQRAGEDAMSSDRVIDLEVRYATPGQPFRHITMRRVAERDDTGRVVSLLSISIDQTAVITERSRAIGLMRRLDVVTEAAGLGVWSVDVQSHAVDWNAQMFRIYGLPPGSAAPTYQRWLSGLVHPDDQREVNAVWQHEMAGGDATFESQFRTVWPDGSVRWLVARARKEQLDGRVLVLGVLIDVTDVVTQHQRADQALNDKLAAERSNQAKSDLLARVSHELRTPLNAVLGFAQLIEQDGAAAGPALQLERASYIRSAGEHLRALIDDLLDLAAIEAGTLPLHREPVALAAVFCDVSQWATVQARGAGVALHTETSEGWVLADARRLRQIIVNLVSNAVKYNRAGGTVWLCAQAAPGGAGPGWQISVRDDGRGLDSGQIEHLFESFNRLGAELEGIEGMGLGLVIVRQLTELMGGRVSVLSTPGQGSEFRVWLPASDAPPAEVQPVAPEPTVPAETLAPSKGLSVLYIEDNAVNVILVQQLFALRPAFTLACMPDGRTGVAQALAEPPDVVLIDMQLPDIDGFEVLRQLRASALLQSRAMIALSANGMSDDIKAAMAAGFDDYWTKPIDVAQFLARLDTLAQSRPG